MPSGSVTNTPPRVRLLAVMAADAVGYSRLMSLDDHGTVAALDAARLVFSAEIAGHAGRVIDMAGDSILAVFENATAAVQAALAIQRQLGESAPADVPDERRMRFRIGVHLGDVIEKADGSVYGDGVNIAARLQSLADVGGVTVSDSVRVTVKGRVSATFEDRGEQSVKNITEPVRVFRAASSSATPSASPHEATRATGSPADGGLDIEPGVAVLPFETAADGPQHAGLADGLVDDIIGSLATVRGLVVIARSSTFTYKGRATDARSVGRELGVRYVVEGSLRVMAQHMRLNVRLIDCHTHSNLWSERFDSPLEDLFMLQDEVTARIMNSIRATVDQSEAKASRKLGPQSLNAWQLRVQAADLFYRWNRGEMVEAIQLCRRAIELAPDAAAGHAYLATTLWAAAICGWMPSGPAAMEEALQAARRSVNLDEAHAAGHIIMASVLVGFRRHDEAIAAAERGLELAPGDFNANCQVGQTFAYGGRYAEALPHLDRALRLSPRDPMIYWVYQSRSIALFGLGRYDELISAAQRVSRQLPMWVGAQTMMAAGFMALGNAQQATLAMDGARKLDPRLTVQRVMRLHAIRDEAAAARLAGLLTAAGLAKN